MQQRNQKNPQKIIHRSDHKVTIYHTTNNTPVITSDGSQSYRAVHVIFILSNKAHKMSFSYCYGSIVQGRLLTHGHGGSNVDEEGSHDEFPL